jgi:hypothetical protein
MASLWPRNAALRGKAEWLTVLEGHCGVGLWDAILHAGDPMHPASRWTWSSEFRRLCGFSNESEFPNVVQSWSDRLHPMMSGRPSRPSAHRWPPGLVTIPPTA